MTMKDITFLLKMLSLFFWVQIREMALLLSLLLLLLLLLLFSLLLSSCFCSRYSYCHCCYFCLSNFFIFITGTQKIKVILQYLIVIDIIAVTNQRDLLILLHNNNLSLPPVNYVKFNVKRLCGWPWIKHKDNNGILTTKCSTASSKRYIIEHLKLGAVVFSLSKNVKCYFKCCQVEVRDGFQKHLSMSSIKAEAIPNTTYIYSDWSFS